MFGIDKIKLIETPSPVERLDNLSEILGINLYIKRDDMLSTIGMGGNKLRKLEYLVCEAEKQGATMLLTYGGAQTNHGRLTAAAAAKRGFKCAIIAVDDHPENMNANLLLDRLMGCDVYIIDKAHDAEKIKAEIFEKYKNEKIYEIPVGGSNELGAIGYMDCAAEMNGQLEKMGIREGKVICAAGSLGTYLGLWTGFKMMNAPYECIGIAISPFDDKKEKRITEYFQQIKSAYNLPFDAVREDFHIEKDYVRGGYNLPDETVRKAIYLMASKEAVILDPCYTGKAFAGILQMIEEGKIKKGENVIFVHTGGSPAVYTPFHRCEMEKELGDGYFLL